MKWPDIKGQATEKKTGWKEGCQAVPHIQRNSPTFTALHPVLAFGSLPSPCSPALHTALHWTEQWTLLWCVLWVASILNTVVWCVLLVPTPSLPVARGSQVTFPHTAACRDEELRVTANCKKKCEIKSIRDKSLPKWIRDMSYCVIR